MKFNIKLGIHNNLFKRYKNIKDKLTIFII